MEHGWVYFAGEDRPRAPVKIGWTSCEPETRLATLQTSSPHPLVVLAVLPGDMRDEAILHRLFRSSRLKGEWFRRCRRVSRTLAVLQDRDDIRSLADLLPLVPRERQAPRRVPRQLPEPLPPPTLAGLGLTQAQAEVIYLGKAPKQRKLRERLGMILAAQAVMRL